MRLARIGQRIRNFDDAYANKVRDLIAGDAVEGPRVAASELLAAPLTYGTGLGEGTRGFRQDPRGYLLDNGAVLGAQAASATARYVVPGAMITAAGAGLADLTQNFYDSMSNTPVLPS